MPQIGSAGYAALVVVTAVLVVLLLRHVAHGPYGRAITAMRDDEVAYAALGRSPMWLKLWVLALGSGIAGVAGGIYALYFRFVSPEQFDVMQSNIILTMVMVGGMRTTWGPVVGAVLLADSSAGDHVLESAAECLGPAAGHHLHVACSHLHVRPAGRSRFGWPVLARIGPWRGAEDAMTVVLEIKNLNKSFGGIRVADDVNLSLSAGRVLGLIGPNGAGKTSLFNLVFGNVKPDSGSVLLNGVSLDAMPPYQRARLGLARTWQHVRLFPSLCVLDNLLIGSRSYPGERLTQVLFRPGRLASHMNESLEKARGILERCGLGGVADQTLADLPYGRQKLVGVARALMNDAQCLLLDEPMAGR